MKYWIGILFFVFFMGCEGLLDSNNIPTNESYATNITVSVISNASQFVMVSYQTNTINSTNAVFSYNSLPITVFLITNKDVGGKLLDSKTNIFYSTNSWTNHESTRYDNTPSVTTNFYFDGSTQVFVSNVTLPYIMEVYTNIMNALQTNIQYLTNFYSYTNFIEQTKRLINGKLPSSISLSNLYAFAVTPQGAYFNGTIDGIGNFQFDLEMGSNYLLVFAEIVSGQTNISHSLYFTVDDNTYSTALQLSKDLSNSASSIDLGELVLSNNQLISSINPSLYNNNSINYQDYDSDLDGIIDQYGMLDYNTNGISDAAEIALGNYNGTLPKDTLTGIPQLFSTNSPIGISNLTALTALNQNFSKLYQNTDFFTNAIVQTVLNPEYLPLIQEAGLSLNWSNVVSSVLAGEWRDIIEPIVESVAPALLDQLSQKKEEISTNSEWNTLIVQNVSYLPDLKIDSFAFPTNVLIVGKTYLPSIRVTNNGNTNFIGNFVMGLYIEQTKICQWTNNGTNFTNQVLDVPVNSIMIPSSVNTGTKAVSIRLDENYAIMESDEANNIHSLNLDFKSLPDMAVTSATLDKQTVSSGESVQLIINFNNINTLPITNAFTIIASIDDVELMSARYSQPFNPSDSISLTTNLVINSSISNGPKTMLIKIDSLNEVDEINEDNNQTSLELNIQ